ncbi:DeoR family transcriptional regulator [Aquisalibacillus elongatus]|nr:DeoR family transcriptional regulator [Aquisalibacillus elongatus]
MINRIKDIYLYLNDQGSATTKELSEQFGLSDRTIQRDINVLQYNGLVESCRKGEWTTTDKKVKLPKVD